MTLSLAVCFSSSRFVVTEENKAGCDVRIKAMVEGMGMRFCGKR